MARTQDSSERLQVRIKLQERNIENINRQVEDKLGELYALQREVRAQRDILAAIQDARGGVYDKWYRYHRENNTAYDEAWQAEKRRMLSEGYEGSFRIIEG